MLPKRVADLSGIKWGLQVDYSPRLKAESEKPVLQSKEEFISYVRKQTQEVQDSGVWIVVTNPDSYSDAEKKLLDDIEKASGPEHLILFVCRAAELPNGWKRYPQ